MSIQIPAWVDGKLTPQDKLAVHQMGLKHPAVSVFVVRGDKILMQRRAIEKYHTPGLWTNTCCTHPHWGEDPLTCAVRRLDDELGITGLSPELRQNLEYRADVGKGMIEHEVVDVFVATATDDLSINPNPAEVSDIDWMTREELEAAISSDPSAFTPWVRIYVAQHWETIFGTK